MGDQAASDAALAQLETNPQWSCQLAEVCAVRGEADRAFEWLNRAFEINDAGLPWMRPSNFLVALHDDPRWVEFLEKIGLAK